MALNEETSLLFDQYLENELSDAVTTAFETRLSQDSEFANDFATYKEMRSFLANEFSEEKKAFASNVKNISDAYNLEENNTKKGGKLIQFKPWQLAVAASVVLALGVVFFNQNSSLDYTDYQFEERISLGVRGDSDATAKEAELLFNTQEYAKAIPQFEQLLLQDPNNAEVQFYKAIAHDAVEDFNEANTLFLALAKGNSAYKNKALYYGAISYWKQDDILQSKQLLHEIPENASEYEKAQQLLGKL